ncbi:MAG TPA: head-tail connector protein [Amaricoccus sp.]|uniref:head-tail connector protein n=1 Tax=Amaricoccus sp. TaxID=1872485 RepID=UPI002C9DAB46|nr:head-tail connector protein [Amaricoccus sp.]HMQ94156.1 head-tail connector protein [Amaricoccus sp.]HMR51497.1 head-tail connector protein [Amaricoccus sp.]HMR60660.1 head-tail connector protein [Amaricoccus sp.]HMT98473.1 head-tail connector protein [Amaricoccus sp.]
MILTELSAPPAAAVPVRAFAEHLRLGSGFADDGAQDQLLELYLRSAMAAIEARLGRVLLARPYSWTVTHWREESCQGLPVGPVISVESITFQEADGSETEAEAGTWSVLRDAQRPRLVGKFGRSLPRIPRGGQAEIRFTAGFGPGWEDVPHDLRQAVLMLAAHFYENRAEGGTAAGAMPFGVLVLIEAYRATRIGGGFA